LPYSNAIHDDDQILSIVNTDTKSTKFSYQAQNLEETELIGREIAARLTFPSCVYLQGSMGAGKTTLTKSIIRSFGYLGDVTSPTYNLIQEYEVGQGTIFHMDLYRLEEASEIEYLAIQDLWSDTSLFLIEWPERGEGYLQRATAEISIEKVTEGASDARRIILTLF